MKSPFSKFVLGLAGCLALSHAAPAQQLDRTHRAELEQMLTAVAAEVQENYYDKKLKGLPWDALVRQTEENIQKIPDLEAGVAQIEGLLARLNDSHTYFIPPQYTNSFDYGWDYQILGDRAVVTQVTPGSDAERQGMKPGDEVLVIEGVAVNRATALKLKFAMYVFTPRPHLRLELRDASGTVRRLDVAATVVKNENHLGFTQRYMRLEKQLADAQAEVKEFGPNLMIVRIPAFFETGGSVKKIFEKAGEHKTLIIDLRGTPGGAENSLKDFLAGVFDREVKIGTRIERDGTRGLAVKGDRRAAFTGNLIVLIDSESASAAEIFARTVQLEKRGTVLGDRSSGFVMEGHIVAHGLGEIGVVQFGVSVTVAEMLMTDGNSLEHVGVEPDKTILPTAADLAAKRDPVMAYAANLAGVTITPEDAAKLFPKSPFER